MQRSAFGGKVFPFQMETEQLRVVTGNAQCEADVQSVSSETPVAGCKTKMEMPTSSVYWGQTKGNDLQAACNQIWDRCGIHSREGITEIIRTNALYETVNEMPRTVINNNMRVSSKAQRFYNSITNVLTYNFHVGDHVMIRPTSAGKES